MKSILLLALISISAHASTITMQENDIPLNTASLEKVIVLGEEIYLRSAVLPCAAYPQGIYGDLYECFTSRQQLAGYLKNNDILMYGPEELQRYLVSADYKFTCNARGAPKTITYHKKTVYHFFGLIKNVQ